MLVKKTPLEEADPLPVDVLPIGTTYPPGHVLPRHEHRRAQLLYGSRGVMRVDTGEGFSMVPADRAVLIPPHTPHGVIMDGVVTWSLYIEPDAVPWWPARCTVVDVTPLLRELLRAANALGPRYDPVGRDGALMTLLLHELRALSPLPFQVSVPAEEPYRGLCRGYLARPRVGVTNSDWARAASMSARSFDRGFLAATGDTPAAWRTRARLLTALPRLGAATVTEVAGELGYDSPAAFTAAFTRMLGVPPSRFR